MHTPRPAALDTANRAAVEAQAERLIDVAKRIKDFRTLTEDQQVASLTRYLRMMRHLTLPHDMLVWVTLWYFETYPETYDEPPRNVLHMAGPRNRSGLHHGEPFRYIDGKHGLYEVSVFICGGEPDGFAYVKAAA